MHINPLLLYWRIQFLREASTKTEEQKHNTCSSTPPWSNIFWKLCSCFNIENNNKPKSKTKLNSQLILRVLNKSHEATEVLVYFFSNPTDLGRRSFLWANSSPFFSFFHFSSLSRSACLENPVRSSNLAVFDDEIKKRIVLEVTKNDRWCSQLNRIQLNTREILRLINFSSRAVHEDDLCKCDPYVIDND